MIYKFVPDVEALYPEDFEPEEFVFNEDNDPTTYPVGTGSPYSAEIQAAVNQNRLSLFGSMNKIVRLKMHTEVYPVKLFLQFVGGQLFPNESEEFIDKQFVQKYIYNLVALGIHKPTHLISVSASVNQLLTNKG
jgi:hypothetical protein